MGKNNDKDIASLHNASEKGKIEVVKLLIKDGIDVNE